MPTEIHALLATPGAILTALIFVYWLFAFGRTLLNLAAVQRLRAGDTPTGEPLVSVVIPARDEERSIERTVRALLAQTYGRLEVIVVNDRSTDGTTEILARLCADPRLIVIAGVEPPDGWLGKPWALHQGSGRATGELLLFIDADVIYAPAAIAAAVAHHERSGATMISLFPRMELHGFWENVAMPQLALTGFTFLPIWLSNRTRIGSLAIGGGPGNLLERTAYEAAGGHQSLRDAVVDDVALARLMRRRGRRTELVRADDLVSIRMYHGLREIILGFTKNTFAVFGRRYVTALLFTMLMFVSQALPYLLAAFSTAAWLRGLPMTAVGWWSLATVLSISVTRLVLFRSLRYRLDNALFLHPLLVAIWSWIFIRSIWFTGVRRQLDWRGRTYDADRTRFGAER